MTTFISCDWGSTRLRVRLVEGDPPAILHTVRRDEGASRIAGALPPDADAAARDRLFAPVLESAMAELAETAGRDLAALPVVASGMVTSLRGWRHVPYADVPFPLDGSRASLRNVRSGRPPVGLVSGVATADANLRGEECELIGLAQHPLVRPLAAGVRIVMPGTHSKHVHVRDGCLAGWRTFLTGELYDVLAGHSVLAQSLSPDATVADGPAFRDGVRAGADEPLGALFGVRTAAVLRALSADACAARLSGVLIGGELSRIDRDDDAPVVLAAGSGLAPLYRAALEVLGLQTRSVVLPPEDVDAAAARGHAILLPHVLARAAADA